MKDGGQHPADHPITARFGGSSSDIRGRWRCQLSWNLFAEWHFILRVNVAFAYNQGNLVDFTDRRDFRLLLKKTKFF